MRAKVTSPLGLQLSADECPAVMGVVLGADAEFDLPHRSCAFLGSMMISTTLRRSAIHAAHHLPDLELGPRAAPAAHRWDHQRNRAAARQVGRTQEARADRAGRSAPAPTHSD